MNREALTAETLTVTSVLFPRAAFVVIDSPSVLTFDMRLPRARVAPVPVALFMEDTCAPDTARVMSGAGDSKSGSGTAPTIEPSLTTR